MDIIAQLRIERDKAAQQVNALDMAIAALSGTTTSQGSRGRRKMSRRTSTYLCRSEGTLGTHTGPEGCCLHRSQAPHFSGRSSTD